MAFTDITSFKENGYVVADLYNRSSLDKAIDFCFFCLKKRGLEVASLEDYHNLPLNEELHTSIQVELTTKFWELGLQKAIIQDNIDVFRHLLGEDLYIQTQPHFRISRPGIDSDNIGYHRDTWYGASAYEVSVSIPLTPMREGSALQVIPGSHIASESEIPYERGSSEIEKGSEKHLVGFAYEPLFLDKELYTGLIEVCVEPSQVLMFSLSTVHGQVINASQKTRFSTDIRLVSASAPIDFGRVVRGKPYYEFFSSSPANEIGKKYESANRTR